MNYSTLGSRCAPQSSLQYHPLPSSVEYGPYNNATTTMDWRPTYAGQVGPYSPYPDDEETSPYTTQPPSYMLPNTDPMSASSGYYVHGHGVRSQPSVLWPESQSYGSQPTSQLSGIPYSLAHEASQSFPGLGTGINLPSDRILPQPITARNYIPTPASSIDIPISTPGRRSHGFWHGEASTLLNPPQTPVELIPNQEHTIGRESVSYGVSDMAYSQANLNVGASAAEVSSGSYLTSIEPQHLPTSARVEDNPSEPSVSNLITPEGPKLNTESSGMTYNYTTPVNNRTLQVRSVPGPPRPGPLYCQTTMLPQREPSSVDCSPDCTSCQTESTGTSFTSITSTLAGC